MIIIKIIMIVDNKNETSVKEKKNDKRNDGMTNMTMIHVWKSLRGRGRQFRGNEYIKVAKKKKKKNPDNGIDLYELFVRE